MIHGLTMRKSFIQMLAISAVGLLLAACVTWSGGSAVKGSGKVVSEVRNVSGFERVSVSGSGLLSIVQGDQESLTIEADDNLLPLIKSYVAGGTLRIGPENVNLNPSRQIHYSLQLKSLKELELSGSLEAEAPSLQTDHLLVSISGSGKVQLPRLTANDLEVRVSGAGDIQIGGKVTHQTIDISGSGNYRAGECESQSTVIHVSGSGDATVWAQQSVEAHVSGSGDVGYYGSPQVSTHVSGAGSVHSLGKK
jgi:hypothetical protein